MIQPAFPALTDLEQAQLYSKLSKSCTQDGQTIKPAVLSVVCEYAASYVPKTVMLDLPQPITTLYDKQARESSLKELQDRAETLSETITVTREQVHITFYI